MQMCEEAKKHDAAVLEWWKRTNGLHTQEKWVTNYRQHPGPWAGLLTIHGVRGGCNLPGCAERRSGRDAITVAAWGVPKSHC